MNIGISCSNKQNNSGLLVIGLENNAITALPYVVYPVFNLRVFWGMLRKKTSKWSLQWQWECHCFENLDLEISKSIIFDSGKLTFEDFLQEKNNLNKHSLSDWLLLFGNLCNFMNILRKMNIGGLCNYVQNEMP